LPVSVVDPLVSTQSSNSDPSASNGPNWTQTAATVALVALGATLIIGGLLLTGVGVAIIGFAVAEILEVGIGAALAADAAAGIGMAIAFYIPTGVGATYLGGKAIGEALSP
jgi:hypothetical protein